MHVRARVFSNNFQGHQKTVWVNISVRREDPCIIAYTIFGLKCDEKLDIIFVIREKYKACCFQRENNAVLGTKKGQPASLERQHQLVNSGNNISFLRIFRSLKVQLVYPNRYIFMYVSGTQIFFLCPTLVTCWAFGHQK